jgi:hypothetical protein
LVQLLRNEYQEDIQRSSEYVNQTVDLGASGQFIHELLVLETNLRQDIAGLAGSGHWQEEETKKRKKRHGRRKMNQKKRPVPDPANQKLRMADYHRKDSVTVEAVEQ